MFALNKTRRRIIFWLAVCFFVITAPLIIAYSQGLRFDFVTREIVRVGAISLDSEPDKATIYLNGEIYGDDTPSVIRGLLPGHLYHIRIEEEGFFDWEKTLTVQAQRITSARGIHLFPKEIIFESIATGTPEIVGGFPNTQGDYFFLAREDGASLYSLDAATSTDMEFLDLQRTLEILNVEWHQGGEHVLFSRRVANDLIWYVLNVEQNELVNLNQRYKLVRPAEQSLSYPDDLNATHIYFLRNGADRFIVSLEGKVYIFNIAASTFTEIGIDNVAFLYSSGNRFFIVNGESTLIEIDVNGNITKSYGTLGFIPERMSLSPNGQRLFYDSNGRGEIIWLQDQELDWHRDVGQIDIIFEEEEAPSDVWWHASSAYILTLDNDAELTAHEIDIRDAQNTYSWDMSKYNSVAYLQQGSRLFTLDPSTVGSTSDF